MVTAIFFLFGVILGSFTNALVWRLRRLETATSKLSAKYSIIKGRSMCVHCKHELAAKDLVPILSWLQLRGKCRYCRQSISVQYPVVEAITGLLFVVSAMFWPYTATSAAGVIVLTIWLVSLVLLIALAVYDIYWYELPDRLVFPLIGLSIVFAVVSAYVVGDGSVVVSSLFGGALIFTMFWFLFQVSKGEWIGGGDVKLAFALGTFAGGALEAFLIIFIASLLGTLFSVPALVLKGSIKGVKIPFGPYLIAATIIVVLFGSAIITWYQNLVTIS